jgi:hypothetical protein
MRPPTKCVLHSFSSLKLCKELLLLGYLSIFVSIRWGVFQVQPFSFLYWVILIGLPPQKKKKTLKLWTENGVPPLSPPTYVGEKRTTLGQLYEIEMRCYWEHWELAGNPLRTWWEQQKTKKKSHHPLPQKEKEKPWASRVDHSNTENIDLKMVRQRYWNQTRNASCPIRWLPVKCTIRQW